MERLENISRIQLINLIFQSKHFQNSLVCYLNFGNLNKSKCRLRIGEVIQSIERSRKCIEFSCHGTILERDIANQIIQAITSPDSIFHIIIKYQKVTQLISKKSCLKYLQNIVLENFYDESGELTINVNNSETFQRIICCDCLSAKEKIPFYCLLDNLAGNVEYCSTIMDLTFVQKFQVAAVCNAGFVINDLWRTSSEDDKKMLLNECKETITLQLASVSDFRGMGYIVRWFLERDVGVNSSHPENQNTILHIAALAGNVEVIEVLLDKGADINALNSFLESPVHAAATGGCLDALRLLWNNNAMHEVRCKDENTPLHNAVDKGHLSVVNFLLENGADVNAENKQKSTPLHIAAIRANIEMINLLLENGAKIDAVDYLKQTPLQKACIRDFSSVLNVLLEKWGARLYSEDSENCTTVLHVAAARGYFKSALVLLQFNANTNAPDTKGKTPLHYAAKGGFHAITRLLLNYNADVFAEDSSKRTAMHEACFNGHQAIVELLISKQENVTKLINSLDQNGRTPLHYACRNGHKCVVEYLLNYKEVLYTPDDKGRTILHEAAWNGHKEIVDLILKKHPDYASIIKVKDYKGVTAMQLASNFGHECNVNLLQSYDASVSVTIKTKGYAHGKRPVPNVIKRNLDINAKNEFGETQLHTAVRTRDPALVKSILERKNLKINLKDSNNATALHLAVKHNCPEIVDMLLTFKNIDLNAKNEFHNTPLHCAVLEENAETLCLFFRGDVISKIKINPLNKDNETPLHLTAKRNNIEVLRILLKRKVDFYAKTSADKTALQIAVENGNLDIVQCLIKNGDDVDVRSKNGETILHLAIKNKRVDVTKWILENYPDYVNFKNCNGNTALHFAIMSKSLAIVEAVLQTSGVMVNLRNNREESPLLLLASNWTKINKEIIKCLLENVSVDVEAKLPNGRSALHLFVGKLNKNGIFMVFNETVFHNSEGSIKYELIKDKLIVSGLANDLDQDGNSVLHLAALTGNQEMLKRILGCIDIKINLKNNSGQTSLHLACREGYLDCVKTILSYQDVSIDEEMAEYSWTPMALALMRKHWNIVRLLLLKGAKVDIEVDSCGTSPLHFLEVHKQSDLIKILRER